MIRTGLRKGFPKPWACTSPRKLGLVSQPRGLGKSNFPNPVRNMLFRHFELSDHAFCLVKHGGKFHFPNPYHLFYTKSYVTTNTTCQRPYHIEHTSSRLMLVLGWVTAWEHWVLLASIIFSCVY